MTRRPANTAGEETFLARWSRRKLAEQEEDRGEASAAPADEAQTTTESDGATAEGSGRLPSDEDMPALETLDEHSDYTGFLSPGVSDELRRRALRKLFHTAGYNVRDGLDDFDEDYTRFEKLGDIVTADMRHRLEMEAEKLRRSVAGLESDAPAVAPGEPANRAPAAAGNEAMASADPSDGCPPADDDEAASRGGESGCGQS